MTLRKLRKIRSNRAGWNYFFMNARQYVSIFGDKVGGVDGNEKYHISTVGWRELKDL